MSGIHGGPDGAYSVVLSGRFEDKDLGECFTYTGEGGRDLRKKGGKRKNIRMAPAKDQTLTKGNLALSKSVETGQPVRVVRGHLLRSPFAPEKGYRYDGLYKVDKYWKTEVDGFKVFKFGLTRLLDQAPPPWQFTELKVDKNIEEPSSLDKSDNEAETDSTEVTQSSGEAETDAMGESSRAPEENEQPESEQCDSNSDNTDLPEASQSHENESEVSVDNKTELIDTDNCDDDSAVGSSQDNPADNTETEAEVRVEDVENVQDVEQSRQEDMDSKDMVSSESENIEESVDAVVDCDRTEEEDVESVSEAEAAKEEMMDTDAHSEDKAEDREVVSTSEGEPMDQE